MTDRFKYSEVRQKIIEAIRTDLVGPVDANEVLEGNPRYEYIVGMLQADEEDRKSSAAGEQEIDTDPAYSTDDNDDIDLLNDTIMFLRIYLTNFDSNLVN